MSTNFACFQATFAIKCISIHLSFDAFSRLCSSPRIPDFVGDSARASAVISPSTSSALFHARAARWDLEAPHSRPSRWGVNIPNVSEWIIRELLLWSHQQASLQSAAASANWDLAAPDNPHSRNWGGVNTTLNNTVRRVCGSRRDELIGAIPQEEGLDETPIPNLNSSITC